MEAPAIWISAAAGVGGLAVTLGGLVTIKKSVEYIFGVEIKSKTRKVADRNQDRIDVLEPQVRTLTAGQIQTNQTLAELKAQGQTLIDLARKNGGSRG